MTYYSSRRYEMPVFPLTISDHLWKTGVIIVFGDGQMDENVMQICIVSQGLLGLCWLNRPTRDRYYCCFVRVAALGIKTKYLRQNVITSKISHAISWASYLMEDTCSVLKTVVRPLSLREVGRPLRTETTIGH